VVESVLAWASNRGVVVIAAAGNGNGGPVCYPGSSRYVTCIAGVTSDRNVDAGSSRGPEVDAAAPSVDVVAPFPRSMRGYGRWHGTSFAAPLFTGGLAQQLAARPGSTPQSGLQALLSTVTPHDPALFATYGNTLGSGVVDVRRALTQ
jgi:subtilisin family serine protease